MSGASIEELERLAFSAWPAEEVRAVEGFRLRSMRGVTRRANSVFTCGEVADLDGAIELAETFYAERAQPALFQISPTPLGERLEHRLAARGYVVDAPVSIQTAGLAAVAASNLEQRAARAEVEEHAGRDFCALAVGRGRFAAHGPIFHGLLQRLGRRAAFAVGRVDGAPVASALLVLDGDWLGLFAMATLPEARRRGAALAVLRAAAAYGLEHGAQRAYLQVERGNEAALSLYARAGFREVYTVPRQDLRGPRKFLNRSGRMGSGPRSRGVGAKP
jgi:ribosomal protein S18 acetylase RimI-like enzyme